MPLSALNRYAAPVHQAKDLSLRNFKKGGEEEINMGINARDSKRLY